MSTYPKADAKTQWWDDDYGWDVIVPNVLVWHTTEGLTWPSYGGGAKAPHITIKPNFANKTLSMRQHFASEHSSRALVNLPGGVTTNTNNAFQIELIGTCDDKYKTSWSTGGKTYRAGVDYIHWPTAPDWVVQGLAELAYYLSTKHKVPLVMTPNWANYVSPGGLTKSVRLSGAAFQKFYGHLGHQHVPENTHGDPGNLGPLLAKVLAKAKTLGTPAKPPAPTPTPTKIATEVTLTATPRSVLSYGEVTLTARVKNNVPGAVQFQWYSNGKWVNFGPSTAVVNGVATIKNRPASTVTYRCYYAPIDKVKYATDHSPNLTVPVVDLASLVARVEKLEQPK